MNKLLLTLCLLISASATAYYEKGSFVVKEVDRLKIITNVDKYSGYRFVTIFNYDGHVLSLDCSSSCRLFATTTHTPTIDYYDGLLRIKEDEFRGDGRWVKSPGVVSFYTEDTPIFSIPGQPNERFIGIIKNSYGASGHGRFTLYLIDTVTGAVAETKLNWGENEWDDNVEFKSTKLRWSNW